MASHFVNIYSLVWTTNSNSFTTLPESTGLELDILIHEMRRHEHPLSLFSEAAKPILTNIVVEPDTDRGHFRCESSDSVEIQSLIDGSPILLRELDPVFFESDV